MRTGRLIPDERGVMMDKETLEALEKSIEKWEKIIAGKGEDRGRDDCALCGLFATEGKRCVGCPVYMKTGERLCKKTPYVEWLKHHVNEHKEFSEAYMVECPTCKELAQKELEFLKSLLPETQKTKGRRENEKRI